MRHIGLVLSGGMGKGAYQIGALSAIKEYISPSDFEYVSAASVGALNAYAFLTDNLDNAQKIWESVNLQGNKRFITSVLKSTFLQDVIGTIATGATIENTFYVPLLDLVNRDLYYYDFSTIAKANIQQYLRASVAMPLYNKGIEIERHFLYDGAVVDNIPIYPLLGKKLDYIICIYFDDVHYIFENYDYDKKILRLTFPDNKIISNSVCIQHDAILSMIDQGYQKTKFNLDFVFSHGLDDLDFIYHSISAINSANPDTKTMRVTGDVMVTNLNKLTKRLLRHNQFQKER